jgi:hypothetical protein
VSPPRGRTAAVVTALLLLAACRPAGRRVTPDEAAREVEAAVADGPVRSYASCQLRSALWGAYKTTVRVDGEVTVDKKPRTFRVDGGRLTVETPAEGPHQAVEVRRWGHVTFASAEEAFAKGAPFFIADVVVVGPDRVTYTVHSNPNQSVDRAAARLEIRRAAEDGGYLTNAEIIETPKPLHSTAAPQAREWKGGRWDDPTRTTLLSIVRGTPLVERCLLSNEIRLESLIAGAAK